jgi:hypothetical protein
MNESNHGNIDNGEATAFIKLNGTEHDTTVGLKGKGAVHTKDHDGMDGRCYIFLYPSQGGSGPTLQKEWPHPTNRDVNSKAAFDIPFDLNDQYLGIKAIFWNTADGKVHLESWLNTDGFDEQANKPKTNNWRPWWFATDHGQMSNEPITKCIGNRTTFRIDAIKKEPDVKCASIREISPPEVRRMTGEIHIELAAHSPSRVLSQIKNCD